jgi:hypothetical protein
MRRVTRKPVDWFLQEISFAESDVGEWRTTRKQAIASASKSSVVGSKLFEKEA